RSLLGKFPEHGLAPALDRQRLGAILKVVVARAEREIAADDRSVIVEYAIRQDQRVVALAGDGRTPELVDRAEGAVADGRPSDASDCQPLIYKQAHGRRYAGLRRLVSPDLCAVQERAAVKRHLLRRVLVDEDV